MERGEENAINNFAYLQSLKSIYFVFSVQSTESDIDSEEISFYLWVLTKNPSG